MPRCPAHQLSWNFLMILCCISISHKIRCDTPPLCCGSMFLQKIVPEKIIISFSSNFSKIFCQKICRYKLLLYDISKTKGKMFSYNTRVVLRRFVCRWMIAYWKIFESIGETKKFYLRTCTLLHFLNCMNFLHRWLAPSLICHGDVDQVFSLSTMIWYLTHFLYLQDNTEIPCPQLKLLPTRVPGPGLTSVRVTSVMGVDILFHRRATPLWIVFLMIGDTSMSWATKILAFKYAKSCPTS